MGFIKFFSIKFGILLSLHEYNFSEIRFMLAHMLCSEKEDYGMVITMSVY